jgi:hypothetical protein
VPFYYDLAQAVTTNGSAGTENTMMVGATVANQETVSLVGLYLASRFGTAGGGQARIKTNSGSAATGGAVQLPQARNLRGNVAAQSVWKNGAVTITAGTVLQTRMTVGFAQTGGMGGWIPIVPQDAIQLMPNATNPVDVELTNLASSTSVTADMTLEIGEGI